MAALPWKEEYRINVSVIDDQHRRLADLAGRLHDTLASARPAADVFEALDDLIGFTRLHFDTEEKLMLEHRYPGLHAHRAAHREVLSRLRALAAHLEDRIDVDFDADADVDEDWVTRHLLERDVELGKFLNAQGVF